MKSEAPPPLGTGRAQRAPHLPFGLGEAGPEVPTILMSRIVTRLDGFPGAPGFMTFYGDNIADLRPDVIAFITAVRGAFPSSVTFTTPADGEIIRDSDGSLAGTWTQGTNDVQPGGATAQFAAPAGACVSWSTNEIVTGLAGRPYKLRGRTFLVPLATPCFDADGTLAAATVANFRTAASALADGGVMRIWHRPTAPGAADGSSGLVTAATVKDRAAILTSRRA